MLVANVPKTDIESEYTQTQVKGINPELGANDRQVGGKNYKEMMIQPWDVIDTLPHAEAIGFYKGNAIKYIMRAGSKGPAREDYEKALHYIQKLLEVL